MLDNPQYNTNNETWTMDEFIQRLAYRTISAAQQMIEFYMRKVLDEKEKIIIKREQSTNPSYVDVILKCIGDRQLNMIHRAQCNLEQQLQALDSNRCSHTL